MRQALRMHTRRIRWIQMDVRSGRLPFAQHGFGTCAPREAYEPLAGGPLHDRKRSHSRVTRISPAAVGADDLPAANTL